MSNYPTGPYCRPEPTAAPQARTPAERERFAAQADRNAGRQGPDFSTARTDAADRSSGRSGVPTQFDRDRADRLAGRVGTPASSRGFAPFLRRIFGF